MSVRVNIGSQKNNSLYAIASVVLQKKLCSTLENAINISERSFKEIEYIAVKRPN